MRVADSRGPGAPVYLDTSALVKLVRDEADSPALRERLRDVTALVSCALVLTELPRAIRRAASFDRTLNLESAIDRAELLIDSLSLIPLDDDLLRVAGALELPDLRSLDAIHVAAAYALGGDVQMLTYDRRQARAARFAGVEAVAPASA